jgi:imidazoleglycerol phosphate dehydratase HisB
MVEAAFKALGRAIAQAYRLRDEEGVASTKGVI